MSAQAKHTPTPWRIDPRYLSEVQTPDDKTISSCWHDVAEGKSITVTGILPCSLEESAANAAFIVRAVNSFDALVAAAKTHLEWIDKEHQGPVYPEGISRDNGGDVIWKSWWEEQLSLCDRVEKECRAALKLAEGQP